MQRNCGSTLEKGKNKDVPLPEKDRKTLITHAHAYLSLKCEKIQKSHLALVAKTLVFLVPSLTDNTEGEHAGFGLTYDFLNKRSRNHRYTQKKGKVENKTAEQSHEVSTEEEIAVALKFLKTVVVCDENMDQIHAKLVITSDRRTQMIKATRVDFLTEFPIFFTHPETVKSFNPFLLLDVLIHQFFYRFYSILKSNSQTLMSTALRRSGQAMLQA